MAAIDDKKVMMHREVGALSSVHELAGVARNVIGVISVALPSDHPSLLPSLKVYDFLVFNVVPNNTDYPDSVAPIGSTVRVINTTAGVVSGATMYLKTAAATWTVMGAVA